MEIFKIVSVLLCYPEQELIDAVPFMEQRLEALKVDTELLLPLLDHLQKGDLISLQEEYVQTFDRNPSCSLHLFEHIHGEDRMRGQALVNLMTEYKENGYDLAVIDELPDYLPLFLEFLSICTKEQAMELLAVSIDVISHVGRNLQKTQSPYAGIFMVLEACSPVKPQPLRVAPVKDMEEAMEKFGPDMSGIEPLLQNNSCNICSVGDKNRESSHALPR